MKVWQKNLILIVLVGLMAALPLGLWEELRAVLRQAKTGKNRGK